MESSYSVEEFHLADDVEVVGVKEDSSVKVV